MTVEPLLDVVPLDEQFGIWPRKTVPDGLREALFGQQDRTKPEGSFAVLDAAKVFGLADFLGSEDLTYRCLFKGAAETDLRDVAPYLVQLDEASDLTRRLFTRSQRAGGLWDNVPGIYLRTTASFDTLSRHLRRFIRVQDENGTWMYLRFWEMRCLHHYLTTIADSPTLAQYWSARAQSVGAHIIIKREPEPAIRPMVPIGQVSSARMPGQYGSIRAGDEMNALDVMSETAWRNAGSPISSDGEVLPVPPSDPIVLVHEIDEHMGPPPPPGIYDIDSMSDAEAAWFVSAIHYMTSDLAGDLTRSAGDAAFQTGDMLSAGNNQRFLREMIGRTVRVETLYNGAKVLIFESGQWDNGMLWYRRHLQYGSKGLGRMQVSSMNIAVRSVSESIGSNLRGMATKTGVVGLIFAVSFDIAEYLSSDGERFLSDLFVSIGFTVANAVLSTIIGTALAAAGIATVAIFGVAASPIIVAGIAIGAIVAVGFSLNRLVATTGVKTAAQNFFRNTDWYKSGLTDAEIYEGAMIAP